VKGRIVLDSGTLGRVCHPRPHREVAVWLERLLSEGASVYIPEIADYEVRRELIRAGLRKSTDRLDALKLALNYLPINTDVMIEAARLWAEARNRGTPTADPKSLDADVILAAQALQINALVATDNVGHLGLFVEAMDWRLI